MIYSVSTSVQISNFLSALGLGFILGIIYFIIEFIRKTISKKRCAVVAQDIIFSLAVSFLEFVFMQIYTDGEVRSDLILASAFGFTVLCLSVGKYIRMALNKISASVNRIILFFTLPIRILKKCIVALLKKFKGSIKIQKSDNEKKKPEKKKTFGDRCRPKKKKIKK